MTAWCGLAPAAVLALVMAGPVRAEGHPVVVELFTSQGCSSCPPADAMLADLAHRQGIIALALHVDYWDYIGWADTFASPAFTRRQEAYARAAGVHAVYTPQMVIGGVDHVIGSQPMEVMDRIMRRAREDTGVSVSAVRSGDEILISARATVTGGMPMVIQLVRYSPLEPVEILYGENAGLTVTYANVVLSWEVVTTWDGQGPFETTAALTGAWPAVVIVQREGHGPILAAAALP